LSLSALLLCTVACGQAAPHAPPAGAAATAAPDDSLKVGAEADAEACVGVEVDAAQLPVDIFAVLDGSSSMSEATSTGVSKWYATRAAFQSFLERAPSGMGFGLSLFPVPGDEVASCAFDHYREAALPIDDVSQMAHGAITRLNAVQPQGQTPTAPALTAALDLASSYGLTHPERSVVVVLATDGLPTACAPTDAAALAELAKEALQGPAHVRTLVVASQALSGGERSGLESIAVAGGTDHSLLLDPHADFARQLGDALDAAAARQVACDLALPEPPTAQRLDYDAVNVVLDGAVRSTLPRVSGPAHCTAAGGWYYDVDPALGAPSRLNMCKASCDRASSARRLSVELGCKTVVR
jgi:hypothetical protein